MTSGLLSLFVVITFFADLPLAFVLLGYKLLRMRHPDAPSRILHWSDAVSALAPFWVWSALGYALAPVKSLANLVEPIWCGWFFSALLALRAVFALRKKRLRVDIWGYATMAAVMLGIVLLLLLVPSLPE